MECVTLNNGLLKIANGIKVIPKECFASNQCITYVQLNEVEVVDEQGFLNNVNLKCVDGLAVKRIEN